MAAQSHDVTTYLEPPELPIFAPVVERRHEDDDEDGDEYSGALYPPRLAFCFVMMCACKHD